MLSIRRFPASVVLLIVLLFTGCQENPVVPEQRDLVIQAYLYAHMPVNQISIMLSRPISSTDTANTPVTNAAAALLRNGVRYPLTASASEAGTYYYAGSDLVVRPGEAFSFEAAYKGTTVAAQTVVPAVPESLSINQTTVTFTKETMTTAFGTRDRISSSDSVIVRWYNPSKQFFYVVVENVDPNPVQIQTDTLFLRREIRFVTQPTSDNFYRLFTDNLRYTGRHKVLLYRVNQEYVDLYKSRQQDSRSLNEPLTNVRNGMGIFTAFASDSLFINVVVQ